MSPSSRILIVEDNAVQILHLQNMLIEMGYGVAGRASSGADAIRLALTEIPDAVLMDIHLSGEMDGIETAQSIRQQLDIPIIYLTAYPDEIMLQQAKVSGAYAFLQKPVRERELRASLEMTIYKHASENRFQHQNQVLRAIQDVNKLIRRAPNAQNLVEEAVKILLNTRGYRFVWVGTSQEDAPHIQASAGEGRSLMEHILVEATSEQRHNLPAVQAAQTRQIVVCQNLLQEEWCAPWHADLKKLLFLSSVSLPISHQDTLFGVLSVYAGQNNHFDPQECELLTELAGDIAFGLSAIAEQAERKQAEDTLRRSEAKYRAVIENSHDGIVFTDPQGNIRYRSPSFEQLTGYTNEERIGRSGFEVIHPEDLQDWQKVWRQAIHNPGVTFRGEYRTRHKNGSSIWVESTVQNLAEDPDVQEVIITSININERKQAEESFHQHNAELTVLNQIGQALSKINQPEQLLELIFTEIGRVMDNRNLFIALYDEINQRINFPIYLLDGKYVQNRSRPLGKGITDHIIRNKQPVLVKQNLEEFLQQHEIELIGELSQSFIAVPILTENKVIGVIALQDYNQSNIYNEHHLELLTIIASQAAIALENARLFSAVQQELEERKRAEQALQSSEALFRTVVENNYSGFILMNADRRPTYVSLSYSRINGFTPDEWIGAYGPDFIHPDDLAYTNNVFEQAIQNPAEPKAAEYRLRHKLGHYFWVETTILNLLHDPNVKAIVLNSRDISERKRAEEALRQSEQNAKQTAEQLRMVNQIGYAIETGLDMEHLLQTLYEQCQLIGDADTFYVAFYDDSSTTIRFPFYYKSGERRYPETRNLSISKGVSGLVINQRKTLYLPDLSHLPEWAAPILQPGPATQSYVGIPLIAGERVIGVFSMQSVRPGAYTPQQIQTLELLATQLAVALQNSQLFEEVQREKKLAEAVVDNLPGVFTLINEQGRILRWNKFVEEQTGFSAEDIGRMNILDLVAETEHAHISSAISEVFDKGQLNLETQMRTQNKDVGIPIYVTSSRAQIGEDVYLVSIGIDITERKQRETELQAIAALSTALRSAPTRVEMLPVIVQHVQSLLRCDSITIEMIDPLTGDIVVEAAAGSWAALIGTHQQKGTGIDAIINATQQPFYTQNMAAEPYLTNPAWARIGIRGATGAPLIAQEKLIGFIWGGSQNALSPADVRLLAAIADIAANAIYRATLHEQTKKDAMRLEHAYDTTLEGWAHALELRDQETEGHTRRVTQKTVDLARLLGMRGSELEDIRRGALLHDIGKMGIPDSVLLKPGTLDEREWEIMRRHPEYALHMLNQIEYLHNALDVSYCHHEKWDGSGYPRGLKGEEIPMPARVFAVVDVWDALTSDRPYRRAWSNEDALRYIRQQSGKHFDPAIAEVFLNLLANG